MVTFRKEVTGQMETTKDHVSWNPFVMLAINKNTATATSKKQKIQEMLED